jgi:hypothetical protein
MTRKVIKTDTVLFVRGSYEKGFGRMVSGVGSIWLLRDKYAVLFAPDFLVDYPTVVAQVLRHSRQARRPAVGVSADAESSPIGFPLLHILYDGVHLYFGEHRKLTADSVGVYRVKVRSEKEQVAVGVHQHDRGIL